MNSIDRGRTYSPALDFILLILILCLHAITTLSWLARDTMIRDGDETGHIGAVELFREIVMREGYIKAVADTFDSPTGDYPPLYTIVSGTLSLLLPSTLSMDDISAIPSLVYFELTMVGTFLISRTFLPSPYPSIATVFLLLLPFPSFFSRYAMPENLLLLINTLTIMSVFIARKYNSPFTALLTGIFFSLGGLTKQTYFIFSLPLVIFWLFHLFRVGGVKRGWVNLGIFLIPSILISMPWYVERASTQLRYILNSAPYSGDASVVEHILYYPVALFSEIGGIPLTVLSIISIPFFGKGLKRWRIPLIILLLSIFMPLLLLTIFPKKYPRLLLPILPPFVVICTTSLYFMKSWLRRAILFVLIIYGLCGYLSLNSGLSYLPESSLFFYTRLTRDFEPNCPQLWIRSPVNDDLLFDEIERVYRENFSIKDKKMNVAFLFEPPIPCEYETTFPYTYHFDIYMRRKGYEVKSLSERDIEEGEDFSSELDIWRPPLLIYGGTQDEDCSENVVSSLLSPKDDRFELSHIETLKSKSQTLKFTLCLYRVEYANHFDKKIFE